MTRTWTLLVLAALAGSVLPLGTARAQSDAEFQAMRKRMAQLEAEVRELRTTAVETAAYLDEAAAAQSAAAAAPAAGCSNGCCSSGGCGQGCCGGQGCGQGCCGECGGACGGGCGDYCCGACPPPCVPLFGFEYVQLRPYAGDRYLQNFATNYPAQLDFEPSYRVWLGWQLDSGLGARVRYWEIDRGEDFGGSSVGVEFRTIDAEVIQSVDLGRWDLLVSGGARYGETCVRTDATDAGFDGTGVTASLTASRDLTAAGGLRFVTTARYSALYGNTKIFTGGNLAANNIHRDDIVDVLELSVGPQVRFTLANGMTVFSGGGVEAQRWSNFGSIGNIDFGFVGLSTNFGITR